MESSKRTTDTATSASVIRVWPGVLIVTLQLTGLFLVPIFFKAVSMVAALASVIGTLAILIWWVFLSRTSWLERFIALPLLLVPMWIASYFIHPSVQSGMMGSMFFIYGTPIFCAVLVLWAVLCRHMVPLHRWLGLFALACCGGLLCVAVKTGGFNSDLKHDFAWRWSSSDEQAFLAEAAQPLAEQVELEALSATDWPSFRGAKQDGKVYGSRIDKDWQNNPPRELWRQKIGPGWSSFSVLGDVFFTMEQRGEEEMVTCYKLNTGELVWQHSDQARFWESNGGAGPRGTPTIHNQRLYSLGATGILNALSAADGSVIWTRNAAQDTEIEVPEWGFSSSPLISGDVVVVAVESKLAGYALASGEMLWQSEDGGYSYASPQRLVVDGIEQVTLMARSGLVSLNPADGSQLWQHAWDGRTRIVQPVQLEGGDLVMSKGERTGIKRIAIGHQDGNWQVDEVWESIKMKPYFSGFVAHKGYLYGIDGGRLACVKAADSERQWKGGRFGSGQLVCLADQDLLILISERGELSLVEAKPDDFVELAKLPALEGKTWNYPVLSGDTLLLRNAQEMVAYQLAQVE